MAPLAWSEGGFRASSTAVSVAGARELLRESPSRVAAKLEAAGRWTGAYSSKPEPAATLAMTRRQERDRELVTTPPIRPQPTARDPAIGALAFGRKH